VDGTYNAGMNPNVFGVLAAILATIALPSLAADPPKCKLDQRPRNFLEHESAIVELANLQ
jgi:hypothetical protein